MDAAEDRSATNVTASGSDDFLASSVWLEQQHTGSGREEGVRAGRLAGLEEGRELGIQKGFEIGTEIGYYSGCIQIWRQLQARNAEGFSPRVMKAIDAMEEIVATYPLENPKDERLQDLMLELRSKFRAIVAMLGVLQDYLPRERAAEPAFSF